MRATVTLQLLLAVGGLQAGQAQVDWPCWRGPGRDGRSPDTNLLKSWPKDGPRLLWKADGIGRGYSTVAIGWGTIYTTGDVNGKLCLFAFDLDGKLRWRQVQDDAWEKPVPGTRATPTLHEGKLYLVSGHGRVMCRNARDGKLIWQRRMGEFGGKVPTWGYSESVLVHDGKAVITPGGKQSIVALDEDTGRTIWVSQGINARAESFADTRTRPSRAAIVFRSSHAGPVTCPSAVSRAIPLA